MIQENDAVEERLERERKKTNLISLSRQVLLERLVEIDNGKAGGQKTFPMPIAKIEHAISANWSVFLCNIVVEMMESSDDTDDEEIKLGFAWTVPRVIPFPQSYPYIQDQNSNNRGIREFPIQQQEPQASASTSSNTINNTPPAAAPAKRPASATAGSSTQKPAAMKRSASASSKEIKYDESGNPILPFKVGVLTILSLGVINYTNSHYHTPKHIYPVGYKTCRLYSSTVNPEKQAVYTSSILDGGENGPLFTVEADDSPGKIWSGSSMSNVWFQVAKGKEGLIEWL